MPVQTGSTLFPFRGQTRISVLMRCSGSGFLKNLRLSRNSPQFYTLATPLHLKRAQQLFASFVSCFSSGHSSAKVSEEESSDESMSAGSPASSPPPEDAKCTKWLEIQLQQALIRIRSRLGRAVCN